jgi:hypothetical protein
MLCVCGASCDGCDHLGVECASDCSAQKGRVYWTQYMGAEVCPVYQCVDNRKYQNCGDCADLPCQTWISLKDPGMSDEEHQKSISARIKLLKEKHI